MVERYKIEIGKELDMDVDSRVAIQEGREAISNPIEALIELITNSLDSYYKMKQDGKYLDNDLDGKLQIIIVRKRKGKSKIGVKDWAEGMTAEELYDYISSYGKPTSGKDKYQSIRGFFGRGLKDVAIGLGGECVVVSNKNGRITGGRVYVKNDEPKFKIDYDKPASKNLLNEKGLREGSTIVLAKFEGKNGTGMPTFDKFAEKLKLAVPLRDAMKSGKITLVQKDNQGNIKKKEPLQYKEPDAELKIGNKDILVKGIPAEITIKKAKEPLDQDGMLRAGGLLIKSGNTIHESTLFKYDNDPAAQKFFGEVKCEYIDELMNRKEPVVLASRRGLNRKHSFVKDLKNRVEEVLKDYVKEERQKMRTERKALSKKTKEKTSKVRDMLNKFAMEELEKPEGGYDIQKKGEKTPMKPPTGFDFIPPFYKIEEKQQKKLLLRTETPGVIPSSGKVKVETDNENIQLKQKEYPIDVCEIDEENGIANIRIDAIGLEPYEKGKITARVDDKQGKTRQTEATIEIYPSEQYPQDGFSFVPSSYKIKLGKKKSIILKIDTNLLEKSQTIDLSSSIEDIIVYTQQTGVEPGSEVVEKKIKVGGQKANIKGDVVARMGQKEAVAQIKITSKKPRPRKSGLIEDIQYDTTTENPTQRVSYGNNIITIYTKENTVAKYFGENGEHEGKLPCQILFAELITEGFCNMLVEELDKRGEVYSLGDKRAAYRRQFNRFRKAYAPQIHDKYVEKKLLTGALEE